MQASVLLVSDDEVLSRSRALLLSEWMLVTATSAAAWDAIEGTAFDLLILCQTVSDDIAAKLAQHITDVNPTAKVLSINRHGQLRRFGTVQYTVDLDNPSWLPNAVSRIMSA